jgi:voltage-gated potassium channel
MKRFHRQNIPSIILAAGLSLVSVLGGTAGYMILEEYSFIDAIYMSVITISTVGFSEVNQLGESGKIFTVFYIIFNLSVFAYILSAISTYIFEGELNKIFHRYRNIKRMKRLKNHVIVCGFGRNGTKAVEELQNSNRVVVVIDDDIDLENETAGMNFKNLHFVKGQATEDEILAFAGLDRAEAIITTLPKDTDNVFVTLTAKQINPNIKVISRASEVTSIIKLQRAGADNIVMPESIGGTHMATLVTKPDLIEFIDLLSGLGKEDLHLDEIAFEDLKKEHQGESIEALNFRKKTGGTVLAIRGENGYKMNPPVDFELKADQSMILLGSLDQIKNLKSTYCH